MISERVRLRLELEFCHLNETESHTPLSWVSTQHRDFVIGATVWEGNWCGLPGALQATLQQFLMAQA